MPDIVEDIKRNRQVVDRPGKVAPTPVPSGLKNEFSNASYKMAAPKKAAAPKEPSMADELNAKSYMMDQARKALQ